MHVFARKEPSVPLVRVVHTDAYEAMLLELLTDRQLDRVEELEKSLSTFPDMGSPVVRDALVLRFGPNLRKVVVDGYLLVYRHDEDAVRMLVAIHGKSVQ